MKLKKIKTIEIDFVQQLDYDSVLKEVLWHYNQQAEKRDILFTWKGYNLLYNGTEVMSREIIKYKIGLVSMSIVVD